MSLKNDYSNIHYLKFTAEDSALRFYNVIIDLYTNSLVSGIITYDMPDDSKSINVENDIHSLKGIQLFAKPVDTGCYWLLDKDKNPVYKSYGYVPSIMEFFNISEGFGDYIDLEIINIKKKLLKTNTLHNIIYFNKDDDWKLMDEESD